MMHPQAVRSLLVEDIAELSAEEAQGDRGIRAAIDKARSRAALVAAVDWLAILALFAFRPDPKTFLVLANSEQGLFTLGVVAIATHAGYRLGQRQKLGAVGRVLDGLPQEAVGESQV